MCFQYSKHCFYFQFHSSYHPLVVVVIYFLLPCLHLRLSSWQKLSYTKKLQRPSKPKIYLNDKHFKIFSGKLLLKKSYHPLKKITKNKSAFSSRSA